MNLIDALNSINDNKKNAIRDSGAPAAAEKQYPSFPVARSLSYHIDSIFFVDELNQRGLSDFGVDRLMHYEFLLNIIPKRRRFGKWDKPVKDDKIDLIKKVYGYSEEKAKAVVGLFTEEQFDALFNSRREGGVNNNGRRKKKSS